MKEGKRDDNYKRRKLLPFSKLPINAIGGVRAAGGALVADGARPALRASLRVDADSLPTDQ